MCYTHRNKKKLQSVHIFSINSQIKDDQFLISIVWNVNISKVIRFTLKGKDLHLWEGGRDPHLADKNNL